jgi:hypothetical protein
MRLTLLLEKVEPPVLDAFACALAETLGYIGLLSNLLPFLIKLIIFPFLLIDFV